MHFDAKSDVDGEHQDTTKSYLAQDHQMHALPPLPWNDIWRKIRGRPQAETASIIEDVSTRSQPSLAIGALHTRGKHRQYHSMRRATLCQFSKDLCASPSSEPSCHVHRPLLRWDVCRDPARTPSGPLRGNHYGIYGRHSAQPASLGCNALPNPERADNHAYEGDDEREGEEGARPS
ncbi:hypothetical protein BC628DRAFT_421033 [Trametes gibbosa]|nr:hypothetical protein BC628DRAFT_421033 [Trametes gibbosa]